MSQTRFRMSVWQRQLSSVSFMVFWLLLLWCNIDWCEVSCVLLCVSLISSTQFDYISYYIVLSWKYFSRRGIFSLALKSTQLTHKTWQVLVFPWRPSEWMNEWMGHTYLYNKYSAPKLIFKYIETFKKYNCTYFSFS